VLAALIIVFREVFEAGLIIGIVMAVTRTVAGRERWIILGVAGGVLGAAVVAMFTSTLSNAFEGAGQELFNAGILGVAVLMLTWHNVWMAKHRRELAAEMREVGHAVTTGAKSLAGLAVVVGVAVLREGVEVVLFLYGVVAAEGSGLGVLAGGIAGLALGALVCLLTYFGLMTIPARYLFGITTVLIAFLEQANVVTALDTILWDTSWILSDRSMLGRAFHTLIGYSDQPTAMQFVVYVATLAVTFALMKLFGSAPVPAASENI